jgi:23S rRNA pseudouridine2604 synthase
MQEQNLKTRINKFLSSVGVCSRREADKLIRQKKITINGKSAKLGDLVSPADAIKVNNKLITAKLPKKIYIALHKPFGVITTTDKNSENNIMQYIDIPQRIYPIGRLDVESSGIILLTNDGEIVNKLLKSRNKIDKEYLLTTNKPLNKGDISKMEKGIFLDGRKTLPARISSITPNQISITIIQGMNRQIRRMCEKLGYKVKILKRVMFADIKLDKLPRGKWRYLTDSEIKSLTKQ